MRFTLFGFASITLLLAAGYFALVTAFPPARMVSLLAEHIKTATGRDFRINGDLSFRLLPTLAVVANDLVLSNADWGSRAEMLKLKRTAFEIALKPLLNGEIRVLKVGLEGADLLLETDQTGRSNWIFTEVQSPRVPAAIPAFDLEQLVISDANITYRDAVSGATRSVFVESFELQAQDEFDLLATSLVFEQHKAQFDGRVGSLLALIAGAAEWPFDLQLKLNGNELSFNGKLGLKPKLRLDGQISSVTVNLEKWGKIILALCLLNPNPAPYLVTASFRWMSCQHFRLVLVFVLINCCCLVSIACLRCMGNLNQSQAVLLSNRCRSLRRVGNFVAESRRHPPLAGR
ncbi:MAG: AsmA family protein [Dechloromonas sp.]|uniref:AsmA family protein n=1 Tax=Candidatus Dechloromonas phosphorivorans TaxID=2899244 RepID=A0A935K198_9RHOO|nr:AsmA family protein [Candidatus Dechloromonas phosphorivorans]